MNSLRPSSRDYLQLLTLSAIFGASFMLTSIAVRDLPPLTVATSRLALAAVLLVVLMLVKGQRLPRGTKIWLLVFFASLFGNALPFALITWAQVKVDAGLTAIFMAVMPLITIVLAHFFTGDERMNRYKLLGVLTGLCGVIVLIGWNKLGQLGDQMIRQYAIALAAVCYALNAIIIKYLTQESRYAMMAALMLSATLMLLPFSILLEQPWNPLWLDAWTFDATISVIVLALGPTALATLLILDIIDRQGASFLSQINFMLPLFAVLFGYVFLQERLSSNAWTALALILAGIAVSRFGHRNGRG